MKHDIILKGYGAFMPTTPSKMLCLGTAESYGIEQLNIIPGAGWEGLVIKATFHPASSEPVVMVVGENGGVIDVPPEATAKATAESSPGVIVFSGTADGVQRISANLAYTVIGHAPVEGKDSTPTPSQWEQLAAAYQSKVDKQQGAENAGKVLGIGEDGMVKPVEQTGGGAGKNGATFIPSVDDDGLISWTNDGDLPNPEPVNIKGAPGEKGNPGKDGENYVLTEADKQEIADKVRIDKAQIENIVAEYLLKNPVESNIKPVEKTAEMTIPVGIDENGQLWVAPIYAPVEPGNTYSVTSILIGVESDNPSAVVAEGGSFSARLTVADGYEITKVVVTMGGVDITADAYSNGVVSIPAVTGDVIITASAVAPTDIMSHFKWLGATTYSPGTYTAWCPTGLIYDTERDVYAHFMHVQNAHYSTPNASELWFNTIDPETLEHSEPVFVARIAEKLTGSMSGAGALGCCVKDGSYYMFSIADRGYYISTDGGATWENKQYENAPPSGTWGCYVLDNGRMIMGNDWDDGKVCYSDDNGKNWATVQSSKFNEPTFIDFGGGTVMAICRENMDANRNIQKPWMHVSNDYGATWTDAVKMETVGYMGNNNCNAYVHDGFVELFVGCRIPTNSPQYTDTLYQINQYVMDLGKGAVDDFEFVSTVYQYKNDDNPQGITSTFTGADDFSTPCIAIRDKAHALLIFYAPSGKGVTHHMIAVGNVPVDHFEIPKPMPTTFNARQEFKGTGNEVPIICGGLIGGYGKENGCPNTSAGTSYLLVDDIEDGGYLHAQVRGSDWVYNGWEVPVLTNVKDLAVYSGFRDTGLPATPMPSGATSLSQTNIVWARHWYPTDITTTDIYARFKDDAWWLFYEDTWYRSYTSNTGVAVPEANRTGTSADNAVFIPNVRGGLTTYKTFSTSRIHGGGTFLFEYDKIIPETIQITNNLTNVTTSNSATSLAGGAPYEATLTCVLEGYVVKATVIMGGVDVTSVVYDNGTIKISAVVGDLVITAVPLKPPVFVVGNTIELTPYDGTEEGHLPKYILDVTAGQQIELEYYLTKKTGCLYDGRKCGMGHELNSNVVDEVTTQTLTVAADGIMTFSGNRNSAAVSGELDEVAGDRLYGKYLKITVTE